MVFLSIVETVKLTGVPVVPKGCHEGMMPWLRNSVIAHAFMSRLIMVLVTSTGAQLTAKSTTRTR